MDITRDDLAFAKSVIEGKISLSRLVLDHTVNPVAVAAVVILHANDKTSFARKSDYVEALEVLCIKPAGEPDFDDTFNIDFWRKHTFSVNALLERTRKLGLYSSSGSVGKGKLMPHPVIEDFLKTTGLKKQAQRLYKAAQDEERKRQISFEKRAGEFRQAVHDLGMLRCITIHPFATLKEVRGDLQKATAIIDQYFSKK